MTASVRLGVALLPLLLFCTSLKADSIQLANGDILNGKVVALDDKHLRVESDVHGTMNIPRAKIVAISFGDKAPAFAPAAPNASASAPAALPSPVVPGKDLSPDDIVKQLKAAGAINPKDVGDITKMLPLLATPEASGMFQDMVQGILSGKMTTNDLRNKAIQTRNQVKEITKGLGPEADDALRPYLGILEKFINESDPARKKQSAEKK